MANYRVYGMAATDHSVRVFVAVHRPNDPRPALRLRVAERPDLGDRELANDWRRTDTGPGVLLWQKPSIDDLEPGNTYEVQLLDEADTMLANAQVTTVPASAQGLHLIAGSCFDLQGRWTHVLTNAYTDLRRRTTDLTPLHLWLGDQVYVDAPWNESTRARDARRVIFDRYLRTWALDDEDTALASAMRQSSNWYLADDHEFWNGYPQPSWGTLFWHTFRRVARQVWRARPMADSLPHPASQGEWGYAAGDAFCVFASPHEYTEFDESVSPDQLQRIELPEVVVVLADTRWRRTIRKRGEAAGFMHEDDLAELLRLLRDEERLVCLALSRPLLGHLPHRGATRGKAEYAAEDYGRQYTELCRALADRRASGRPTIVVGGDVHRHAIRTGLDDGLLEVVSSSMSILHALDDGVVKRVRDGWRWVKRLGRRGEERLRRYEVPVVGDVSAAYPAFDDAGEWSPANGTQHFAALEDRSGIAGIEFDVADPDHPRVTVRTVTDEGDQPDPANGLTVRTRAFRWDGAWQAA